MNIDRFRFRIAVKTQWGWKRYEVYSLVESKGKIKVCARIPGDEYRHKEEIVNGESVLLEQSTGLRDRNGTLIYEGDVVKDESSGHIAKVYRLDYDVVYRITPEYEARSFMELIERSRLEVIGNIHDTEVAE